MQEEENEDFWWYPAQDESDPMDMGLVVMYRPDVLVMPGYGRLLVKRTMNGARLFELTVNGNVTATLVPQVAPNEIRLVVEG